MRDFILYVLVAAVSYVCGSLPSAYLMGRLRGVDVLESGSGSSGATNALRTMGRLPALLVLAADAAKGIIAVLLAESSAGYWGLEAGLAGALAAGAAVLGHVFSPWIGFRGGKGVATGAATALTLAPLGALPSLLLFLLTVAVTRYVSLASLVAAVFLPFGYLLTRPPHERELSLVVYFAAASLLVVYAHRRNIVRLLRGEEPRIGESAPKRGEGIR